jgi:hypothetical protein
MNEIGTPDPQLVPSDRAVSAIRAWVAFYTRGLPVELAVDRRNLIEADLWDEAQAATWLNESQGLARQRWSRWLRGMPADVSWRVRRQRRTTRTTRRTDMRISKGQTAAIGAVTIFYVVLIIAGLMTSASFREWTGMWPALIGLGLSVVGLLLAIPRAEAGFAVGMIGTGITFLVMPWMFPFYLPIVIVLGYRLWRGRATAQPPAPGT